MTSKYYNSKSLHRQELEKFLSGETPDPKALLKAYSETEDARIKDLCRILMKTTKVKSTKELAGEEGNLDSLLIRRNARILSQKFC